MSHSVLLRRFIFLLIAVCIVCSGCGKVGDPLPPRFRVPENISNLTVVQNQSQVVLTWTNPSKYIDGAAATDLWHVSILRNGTPITNLPINGPGKIQSVPVEVPPEDVGKISIYAVEIETQRGKKSVSNGATITALDVPGVVTDVRGVMDQGQILLNWQVPTQKPTLAEVYLVRRQDRDAPEKVTVPPFIDTQIEAGKTYQYVVTPAREGNPPVGGPSSGPVSVVAVDRMKPQPPTGLQPPVVTETGAFIRWDMNTETDIASYRVYRSDNPNAGFTRVDMELITGISFPDPNYRPGFYYRVTAVDESGNESDPSAIVRAPE